MSVPVHEPVLPSLRLRLANIWDVASTPARALIVAWALLPLVVAVGLTRMPWSAPAHVDISSEVDPSYVTAQRARASDDQMKADVGTLGSLMEDCFARRGAFGECDTPAELQRALAAGIELGRGAAKIEVARASGREYRLIGVSQSGGRFALTRRADGSMRHTCSRWGAGGCSPHGIW